MGAVFKVSDAHIQRDDRIESYEAGHQQNTEVESLKLEYKGSRDSKNEVLALERIFCSLSSVAERQICIARLVFLQVLNLLDLLYTYP